MWANNILVESSGFSFSLKQTRKTNIQQKPKKKKKPSQRETRILAIFDETELVWEK